MIPGAIVPGTLSMLLLAGCWGSSSPEPEQEAKELKSGKEALSTEVPEAELTHLSKKLYQVGMYSVARDSLASLKDRYPLGAYASFAELKHADSFFFNREYDQAAKLYEDYVKNYPASSEVPYAKLQAARSHVASAKTDGRDRQPWERALTMYDDIVASFSETAYADLARQERNGVVKELSAYDREIINFYRKTGNTPAVEDRERRFAERWGARLSEVERTSDTTPTFKSLRELSPIAFVPRPAETQDLRQDDSLGAQATATPSTSVQAPLTEGRIVVQRVQCSASEPKFATVELTQIPPSLASYDSSPLALTPENGTISIKGTNLTSRQPTFDCFGSKDLEFTPDGDIKISSDQALTVSVLHEPPRLLIAK